MTHPPHLAHPMTTSTAKPADISLPLLKDYIDALLPSLNKTDQKHAEQQGNDRDLLWIAQDDAALSALQSSLEKHTTHDHTDNSQQIQNIDKQLSTLSTLARQPVPERYELACFWLPHITAEQLQQYVPLLMRYRDLYAAHLLVALDGSIDLKPYGFTPFDILNDPSLGTQEIPPVTQSTVTATLWQFNLYDYKQLPNWLNADYWANPENWGKHRW